MQLPKVEGTRRASLLLWVVFAWKHDSESVIVLDLQKCLLSNIE